MLPIMQCCALAHHVEVQWLCAVDLADELEQPSADLRRSEGQTVNELGAGAQGKELQNRQERRIMIGQELHGKHTPDPYTG